MADATTPHVVRSYLAQLEKALAGVAAEVRDEIVAGVAEELSGLDSVAAAARIELLGDPEFIAAEARTEATEPAWNSTGEVPSREPGWYPVLAALLVAFGGVVVPAIGWIVGIAMVWLSRTWTRGEKWVATLAPFAATILATVVVAVTSQSGPGNNATSPMDPAGGFHAPTASEFVNPLLPSAFDLVWSGAVLFLLVNVAVGIWLLWRANRAWATSAKPKVTDSTGVQQASWYPIVAVLLIVAGGYLVPFVGWVAGIVMLWRGDRWSNRDKWVGTMAGLLAALAVVGMSLAFQLGAPTGLIGWHTMILGCLVAPFIANLIAGIHLLRNQRA